MDAIKKYGAIIVAVGLLAVLAGTMYSRYFGHPSDRLNYPYWCKDCKAVFDFKELKKPGNWRIAPGAESDSVVQCLRCQKGWAYPVATCDACGTRYMPHLTRTYQCPKCFPDTSGKKMNRHDIDPVFQPE